MVTCVAHRCEKPGSGDHGLDSRIATIMMFFLSAPDPSANYNSDISTCCTISGYLYGYAWTEKRPHFNCHKVAYNFHMII